MTVSGRTLAGGTFLVASFLALWANSAYLWAFASPTLFYFVNVALHPALGLFVAVLAIRGWIRARPIAPAGWLIALVGVASLVTGLVVLGRGAFGAYRELLLWHVGISAALIAVVVVTMARAIRPDRARAGGMAVASRGVCPPHAVPVGVRALLDGGRQGMA